MLERLERKQKRFLVGCLFLLAVAIIIGTILDFFQAEEFLETLQRPEAFEKKKEVSFFLEYEKEEDVKLLEYKGFIGERILTEKELEKEMEKVFLAIEEGMFYEGEGPESVKTGIRIPEKIKDSPLEISWEAQNSEYFDYAGNLLFRKLGREAKETKIKVKASYRETEEVREYFLKLVPEELSEEEKKKRNILKEIDKALLQGRNSEIVLPSEVHSTEVLYKKKKSKITPIIFGMGLLIVTSALLLFYRKNSERKVKREKEFEEAYAYFVGRFVILLGAGLNLLSVWKKLGETVNFNKSLNEEIEMTLWEIGNGKTEKEAYENFGRRIGGLQYPKFSSILTENLKMGSNQVIVRLSSEAKQAMIERKNQAKVMGETAGLKFLMPMLFELVLIMLMILVPSMMATSIS